MTKLAPSPVSPAKRSPAVETIRGRAFLVGTALILFNDWLAMRLMRSGFFPTAVAPFPFVVFLLILLTWVKGAAGKGHGRRGWSRAELLAIYTMVSIAAALNSEWMMGILVPVIGHAHHFATAENRWGELFLPYLPSWLVVRDPRALRDFYGGGSSLYTLRHLQAWLVPITRWSAFIVVLALVMLCLSVLLRKQWLEQDRLSFPIVQLPLALGERHFFQNRWMWVGFAVAGGISLLNGLSVLFPAFPSIPVKRQNIGQYFTDAPWNAIADLWLSFYPFAIALSFMVPVDLSLSCGVFYGLHRAQQVFGASRGWTQTGGFPYDKQQAFGAYLAVFLAMLWTGRSHLRAVIMTALGKAPPGYGGEAGVYRTALLGLAAGLAFLTAFAMGAGLTLWMAATLFLFYLIMAVLVTRIRIELGFPVHDITAGGYVRLDPLMSFWGSGAFNARELTGWSSFRWFNLAYLGHPMPFMAEGFKLMERSGGSMRRLTWAIVAAILVGVPASWWVYLDAYYRLGAPAAGGHHEVYAILENWLQSPKPPSSAAITAAAVGFTFACLLSALRTRFLWFSLHPLAYALAPSWGMEVLWSCVVFGGLLKAAILRYGGFSTYRGAISFFLGVLLGEFTIGGLWALLAIVGDIHVYALFP